MSLNAKEAVVRVRERIHDREGYAYDNAEVLRVLDDAVREIFTMLRAHGDAIGQDFLDVPLSSLTRLETGVAEYVMPEVMADPQLLELHRPSAIPYPIPKMPLEHKDISRGIFPGRGVVWHWGRRGSLQIRGGFEGWPTLRIWFIARLSPVFYGHASSGSTTTTIVVNMPQGAFKPRNDIYVGQDFEATSGPNEGQVRRCSAQAASTLTVDAFPSSMASAEFAQLLPVPDEHTAYLVELCSLELLSRSGSAKEQAMKAAKVVALREQFEIGIASRQTGEPPRLYSSRQVR